MGTSAPIMRGSEKKYKEIAKTYDLTPIQWRYVVNAVNHPDKSKTELAQYVGVELKTASMWNIDGKIDDAIMAITARQLDFVLDYVNNMALEAWSTVYDIMTKSKSDNTRLKAAEMIISYSMGKPVQSINVSKVSMDLTPLPEQAIDSASLLVKPIDETE